MIQNSRTVGGKQQATFAGYFDRLDSFIEAIRHARTSITSLYKPSTFHLIEAVRRRASSHESLHTGLNPTAYTARTARTVRRRPRVTTRVVTPRGCHHDSDTRRGCDTWITTGSRPSSSLSLRAVIELRHVSFPPGLNHGRHPYFYRMDIDTSTGLPARVSRGVRLPPRVANMVQTPGETLVAKPVDVSISIR